MLKSSPQTAEGTLQARVVVVEVEGVTKVAGAEVMVVMESREVAVAEVTVGIEVAEETVVTKVAVAEVMVIRVIVAEVTVVTRVVAEVTSVAGAEVLLTKGASLTTMIKAVDPMAEALLTTLIATILTTTAVVTVDRLVGEVLVGAHLAAEVIQILHLLVPAEGEARLAMCPIKEDEAVTTQIAAMMARRDWEGLGAALMTAATIAAASRGVARKRAQASQCR